MTSTTTEISTGTRVSYMDMANPLREGVIVGEVAGQWAVLWDDRDDARTLELDGLTFHTTVTKHMLERAVERQADYRAEGRGARCGGWDASPAAPAPTAYQLVQRLAKALREDELVQAHGAVDELRVWSGADHARFSGHDTKAPALCWESGPYEWAVVLTGTNGERLSSDYGPANTSQAVRDAYAAIHDAGFYVELTNSFVLALYPRLSAEWSRS